LRELDIVRVKGKENYVTIYDIVDYTGNADINIVESMAVFHKGLFAYRKKEWEEAEAFFRKTLELNPSDGPSVLYLKRIEKFRLSPPPDGWNGSAVFESK
jgi:adenylate cyclase